jgi:nitroreductase
LNQTYRGRKRHSLPLPCWAVDVSHAIRTRRTHKQYGSDPVDDATLRELVDLARFAPNHHLTQPWRFRALGPETRARISELAGEKEAMKLRRAPTLVLATAALGGDPKTDEEDLHSTAAAVYAVLLGATERGLASYWRTPACFDEPAIRAALGLESSERAVALIHLGPAVSDPPAKERLPPAEILRFLS